MAYCIKYGLADYYIKKNLFDIQNQPFTFKFDETTTKQVKKQYDAYINYFSPMDKKIINTYAGSLFLGYCKADDLLDHYRV